MAIMHMKKYSTSLIIREMQTKTGVRYHFTPLRMAIIRKSTNAEEGMKKITNAEKGVEKRGPLLHC